MTRAAELVELDDDELQNRLANSRRELLNLRFQLATGQLDNSARMGEVRRDIARALTILRARDLYEEDVELAPLVLTPARRVPLDETGGVESDEDADEDEDEDTTDLSDAEADDTVDEDDTEDDATVTGSEPDDEEAE
jgi:large subunit ribosomal protein L29